MLQLLDSDTSTGSFFHAIKRQVSLSAFFVYITGTNPVTPLTLADLGRIRYGVRGRTRVDADIEKLVRLSPFWGGEAHFVSTASGELSCGFFIPRFWMSDNVELVQSEDNAQVEVIFGAAVANQTGFRVELYAVPDEGIQSYELLINQTEDSFTGAGEFTMSSPQSTVENIVAAYLSDDQSGATTLAATTISRVRGRVGSRAFDTSIAALLSANNRKRVLSLTAGADYVGAAELFATEISDLTGKLGDDVALQLTLTGTAKPQLVTMGLAFNPNKLSDTTARQRATMESIVARKAGAGKTRTLSTISALAGR